MDENKKFPETQNARNAMVEAQLKARDITDPRVLEVMARLPRHLFVPADSSSSAYDDGPLPIGYNQTISQPYIVAYMTQALQIQPDDKILEIGTGSGYQTAALAEIAKEVYSIEIVKELAESSGKILRELGYKNIYIKYGDGYKGWPSQAPFDAVIITAAPEEVPQALLDQLKEGGRMMVPVGARDHQQLMLITKTAGGLQKQTIFPVRFVPMVKDVPKE